MGQIAEALRSNLRSLAESDARSLRGMDQELKAARVATPPRQQVLLQQPAVKALLGGGTFQQHTVATLKRICKENGIKGVSKLRKAEFESNYVFMFLVFFRASPTFNAVFVI